MELEVIRIRDTGFTWRGDPKLKAHNPIHFQPAQLIERSDVNQQFFTLTKITTTRQIRRCSAFFPDYDGWHLPLPRWLQFQAQLRCNLRPQILELQPPRE